MVLTHRCNRNLIYVLWDLQVDDYKGVANLRIKALIKKNLKKKSF